MQQASSPPYDPSFFATILSPAGPPAGFEMPAIPQDLLSSAKLSPPPQSVLQEVPDLLHWLEEVHDCQDPQRLEFMDAFLRSAQIGALELPLLINIQSRRCQLELDASTFTPHSPSLRKLVDLLQQIPTSDLATGLLLNNLAVCCYQYAFQQHFMPPWEEILGVEPLIALKHWLNHTEPAPSKRTSARLWEIRERSRETIEYCHKIKMLFSPASQASFSRRPLL